MKSSRAVKIIRLGTPLLVGQLSHYLHQIADSAMLGHYGPGSLELAAIGIAGLLTWILLTFLWPLSTGVMALASRRFGREDADTGAVLLVTMATRAPIAALFSNDSATGEVIVAAILFFAPFFFVEALGYIPGDDPGPQRVRPLRASERVLHQRRLHSGSYARGASSGATGDSMGMACVRPVSSCPRAFNDFRRRSGTLDDRCDRVIPHDRSAVVVREVSARYPRYCQYRYRYRVSVPLFVLPESP